MPYLSKSVNYKKFIFDTEEIQKEESDMCIEYEFHLFEALQKKMKKFISLTHVKLGYDKHTNPIVDFVFDKDIYDAKLNNLCEMNGIGSEQKPSFIEGYLHSLFLAFRDYLYMKIEMLEPFSNITITASNIDNILSELQQKRKKTQLIINEEWLTQKEKKAIKLFNDRDPIMIHLENRKTIPEILQMKKMEIFFFNLALLTEKLSGNDSLFIRKSIRKEEITISTNNIKLKDSPSFKMIEKLLQQGKWSSMIKPEGVLINQFTDVANLLNHFHMLSQPVKSHMRELIITEIQLYNIDKEKERLTAILNNNVSNKALKRL